MVLKCDDALCPRYALALDSMARAVLLRADDDAALSPLRVRRADAERFSVRFSSFLRISLAVSVRALSLVVDVDVDEPPPAAAVAAAATDVALTAAAVTAVVGDVDEELAARRRRA